MTRHQSTSSRDPLSLEQARELVLHQVHRGRPQWVPLSAALGRSSAKDYTAPVDLPSEPRSLMDGYAIAVDPRRAHGTHTGMELRISKEVMSAGGKTNLRIVPGEAIRILTGARLPEGCRAIIPQELCEVAGDRLKIRDGALSGTWISHTGCEVRKGTLLVSAGTVLSPTHLTMLTSFGYAGLSVVRRPRVALLATGDELIEPGLTASPGQGYCTTRYLIQWMVEELGGSPMALGIARDDPVDIRDRLEEVDADMVITTGGTGRGDRDFISQVWQEMAVTTLIDGIRLKPGKSFAMGSDGNHLHFALPGSPWAAQVLFLEVIAPAVRKYLGSERLHGETIPAILETPLRNPQDSAQVVAGRLHRQQVPMLFEPLLDKNTPLFEQIRQREGYLLVPPHTYDLPAGTTVAVRSYGCD